MIEHLILYDFLELLLVGAILFCFVPIAGKYIADIISQKKTVLYPVLGWLETLSYRIAGINPFEEMNWWIYTKALLWFNFFGFLALFSLLLFQNYLPLNPQNLPGVPWDLAFNIAASFTTNTNWQSYAGETTLSYFSQMVGLTSQNFLSAATGVTALMGLIRGLTRKEMTTIGNFWADLIRTVIYLLLPLSIILAIILASLGVIQTFSPYIEVTTLENASQTIPLGPVASLEAIKQLGTNGGGFFNVNSAHPFENPTALTNWLETLAILFIPITLVYSYGIMIGARKHALGILLSVMCTLFILGLAISVFSEQLVDPAIGAYPNMEGKETRFGVSSSLFWTVATTATANGSVNCALSSLSPLAGGVALFNIMLGEIIFGGVGVGLCGMIMFTLLTVFLSGLMVGRTPEYLGKKIEMYEIKWVVLAVLAPTALVLIGSGIFCAIPEVLGNLNQGPHGLTEVLYAFASAAGNNGSSFAGLNSNTLYYNLSLGCIMLMGRAAIIMPSLAIAGSLISKNATPPSLGTFSTNSFIFGLLLIAVILIVGALSYFPALSLGPIAEQLLMLQGKTF